MARNLVRPLMKGGNRGPVRDLEPAKLQNLKAAGAIAAADVTQLVAALSKPRAVWIMVPAGDPTEQMVNSLAQHLEPGDAIIDGGNSYFKDDVRRAKSVAAKSIDYVDAGTSA